MGPVSVLRGREEEGVGHRLRQLRPPPVQPEVENAFILSNSSLNVTFWLIKLCRK